MTIGHVTAAKPPGRYPSLEAALNVATERWHEIWPCRRNCATFTPRGEREAQWPNGIIRYHDYQIGGSCAGGRFIFTEYQCNAGHYFANDSVICVEGVDPSARGVIAAIPNREMTYNDVGRLYQLTEEGILKVAYIYNDMGQRTRKTTYQQDGITIASTTIYHYDQMGMLITETTETGVVIKYYILVKPNDACGTDYSNRRDRVYRLPLHRPFNDQPIGYRFNPSNNLALGG